MSMTQQLLVLLLVVQAQLEQLGRSLLPPPSMTSRTAASTYWRYSAISVMPGRVISPRSGRA